MSESSDAWETSYRAWKTSFRECFYVVKTPSDGAVNGTNGAVPLHQAVDTDAKPTAAAGTPGHRMADGTVFAGISPDTHEAMYATPVDAPLTYSFRMAKKYAKNLDANGHHDWRVPTKRELDVLFNNRAAIGGFDKSPASSYWSSSQNHLGFNAWAQRFSDGRQMYVDTDEVNASLRCVR